MIERLRIIGRKIAAVQTRVILVIVYIILSPVMLIVRRRRPRHGWSPWKHPMDTLEDARRQG